MTDALSLIRDATINKKDIEVREGLVYLGDFCWDVKSKTNYMVWGSGRDGQAKEYYTIETILFFLDNVEMPHPQYIKAAIEKFGATEKSGTHYSVSRPDRKDLLAYLQGGVTTSSSIDRNAPTDIGRPRPRNELSRPTEQMVDDVEGSGKQEQSERLRTLLEKGPPLVISQEHLAAVSDKLTSEKLAAIKTKIRTRKRGQIADTDIISGDIVRSTDQIGSNNFERVWKTRVSILQSTGQNFKPVLNWLEVIKKKESGVTSKPEMIPPNRKDPRKNEEGYSRYEQERFKRSVNTGGFQINTIGTNAMLSLNALVASGKRPAKKDEAIPIPNPVSSSPPAKKGRGRTPIIIVPASSQSIITLSNIQNLLEKFKYITHEQAKKMNPRVESEVLIRYKTKDRTVSFKAVNNVSKLSHDDWDRVVAVFVQGPAWQFKGWPIMERNDVNTIFKKIMAFHLKWSNKAVEGNIKKWNCSVIDLDLNNRHLDVQKFRQLWQKLEFYCVKERPNLRIF